MAMELMIRDEWPVVLTWEDGLSSFTTRADAFFAHALFLDAPLKYPSLESLRKDINKLFLVDVRDCENRYFQGNERLWKDKLALGLRPNHTRKDALFVYFFLAVVQDSLRKEQWSAMNNDGTLEGVLQVSNETIALTEKSPAGKFPPIRVIVTPQFMTIAIQNPWGRFDTVPLEGQLFTKVTWKPHQNSSATDYFVRVSEGQVLSFLVHLIHVRNKTTSWKCQKFEPEQTNSLVIIFKKREPKFNGPQLL
jgi:hypothetical protein